MKRFRPASLNQSFTPAPRQTRANATTATDSSSAAVESDSPVLHVLGIPDEIATKLYAGLRNRESALSVTYSEFFELDPDQRRLAEDFLRLLRQLKPTLCQFDLRVPVNAVGLDVRDRLLDSSLQFISPREALDYEATTAQCSDLPNMRVLAHPTFPVIFVVSRTAQDSLLCYRALKLTKANAVLTNAAKMRKWTHLHAVALLRFGEDSRADQEFFEADSDSPGSDAPHEVVRAGAEARRGLRFRALLGHESNGFRRNLVRQTEDEWSKFVKHRQGEQSKDVVCNRSHSSSSLCPLGVECQTWTIPLPGEYAQTSPVNIPSQSIVVTTEQTMYFLEQFLVEQKTTSPRQLLFV